MSSRAESFQQPGVEKDPQPHSRIVQTLNVPQGYASGPSLAAALPVEWRVSARQGWAGEKRGLFEHPTDCLVSYSELFRSVSHDTVQSHELRR